jgi:hypothetical protein
MHPVVDVRTVDEFKGLLESGDKGVELRSSYPGGSGPKAVLAFSHRRDVGLSHRALVRCHYRLFFSQFFERFS